MSYIVQTASAINTAGGATATATFSRPVTAGSIIVVAAAAIDHGAPSGLGQFGAPAGSQVAVNDSQNNSYSALTGDNGPFVWDYAPGGVNTKAFWLGQYVAENVVAGTTEITFEFTPYSSGPNCHVGIAVYELSDFNETYILGQDNDNPTADVPVDFGGSWFQLSLGSGPGRLYIECAAVLLSTDHRALTANTGNGYTLDGADVAEIGGAYSTLGFQHKFNSTIPLTDNINDYGTFGSVPTTLLSGVAYTTEFNANSTFTNLIILTGSLPNAVIGQSYNQALAASVSVAPYTWSIISGSLPPGLSLDPTTGIISGTPTEGGNFSATVQISDSSSPAQVATATLGLDCVAGVTSAGGWAEYSNVVQQRPQPQIPRGFVNHGAYKKF